MTNSSKLVHRIRFLNNIGRFYLSYFLSVISGKKRSWGSNNDYVLFDIKSRISERHYAHLLFCFDHLGQKIILKTNHHFIGNLSTYGASISRLTNLNICLFKPKGECLLFLTDYKKKNEYVKTLFIKSELPFYNGKIISTKLIPFFMIPRLYLSGMYRFSQLAQNKFQRPIKIFFSGNLNEAVYDNHEYENKFQKLNRISIIETLIDGLSPKEIMPIDSIHDLDLDSYYNYFVFTRWIRKSLKEKHIKGRTKNEDWLKILSDCHFFLACPGISQPLCHNVIEAMSVGCIPIIEHPEFFNPPLENGKNAIVFSGKNDLVQKVNWALENNNLETLHQGVYDYYENYLNPKSVAQRLLRLPDGLNNMHIIETARFLKK